MDGEFSNRMKKQPNGMSDRLKMVHQKHNTISVRAIFQASGLNNRSSMLYDGSPNPQTTETLKHNMLWAIAFKMDWVFLNTKKKHSASM